MVADPVVFFFFFAPGGTRFKRKNFLAGLMGYFRPTFSSSFTFPQASKISIRVSPREPLLATVERPKFTWFGHVTRHATLSKTILQGSLEDGRRRGRQRKCWMDNTKEWVFLPMQDLLTMACCRKDLKKISPESSLGSPPPPRTNPSLLYRDPIGHRTELNLTLIACVNRLLPYTRHSRNN